MTVRVSPPTFSDTILHLFGKRRAIYIGTPLNRELEKYQYRQAQRESFWKALLRKKNTQLPPHWVYLDDIRGKTSSE